MNLYSKTIFNFRVSENALKRLKIIVPSNKRLKITVDAGGCSGFQYDYNLVSNEQTIEKNDYILKLANGIEILIDEISMRFLNNAELDYVSNLGAAYFSITNPNATKKCGCGNSFNVES